MLRVNFVFFWPCIIYMVAGVASLFNALHYELVFFELFRIATLIMILLLTMNFGRIRHLRVFLIFLIVGMCLEGTLACIQYATGKTIAEYVEDEKTLELLKSFGVDYVQGHYISKPLTNIESIKVDTDSTSFILNS